MQEMNADYQKTLRALEEEFDQKLREAKKDHTYLLSEKENLELQVSL